MENQIGISRFARMLRGIANSTKEPITTDSGTITNNGGLQLASLGVTIPQSDYTTSGISKKNLSPGDTVVVNMMGDTPVVMGKNKGDDDDDDYVTPKAFEEYIEQTNATIESLTQRVKVLEDKVLTGGGTNG